MASKKIILGICVVLAVAVVGYFLYANGSLQGITAQNPGGASDQQKIDINAVCEGALAYMTFPDAASAQVFVQECKDGKHPEVIERYKAQIGAGDGAAI